MLSSRSTAEYAAHLQRACCEELGFIPLPRLVREAEKGRILLADDGGDECAFLLRSPFKTITQIHQAAVEMDLRRERHGSELVANFLADCRHRGVAGVTLNCRDTLAARRFWFVMGFSDYAKYPAGRRGLFVYRMGIWFREPELNPFIGGNPS